MDLVIIGGGLAGPEAAWQAAQLGIDVTLYEMRPVKMTEAHKTSQLAELVCSNSLRSNALTNAVGLLKEEMRRLHSLIMEAADTSSVPAGVALAVDREKFSSRITERLEEHPRVTIVREEVISISDDTPTIIATGPLTSEKLANKISSLVHQKYLYFYDAIAPIIDAHSIDFSKTFFASRYDKGGDDYLNCPLSREEYDQFYEEVIKGVQVPLREFEEARYFEGCLPIEEMARRGPETLLFGPMKPVGLKHRETGENPSAIVQLRKENVEGTMFNMVGFQTKLTFGEQKRIFRMIPGLEKAEFLRYGIIHRNTYINAPSVLKPTFQVRNAPHIFFAGQITGVEGYVESAASGILAGINAARLILRDEPIVPPETTILGSLAKYISSADPERFQPMNANFGLLPPLETQVKKNKMRKELIIERAMRDFEGWIACASLH
ncbi:MAG: methylenetetrahydrofolate--tRNA-(uracil(54)-C(5))-methyltransferase (FADH(2)-oxidizing) TrmFO [Candidatus Tectomicrobia bacterium]|nr:methylenetetrahydrofolate--tRNA-(uracil(54)-C(5))-methyltransferase (FADH(2)-oxidizing) TrmFO [Candidatus Tectomicrobia bacterium]